MTALICISFLPSPLRAEWDDEPKVSTNPIGSPYYRHLANDMHLDLRQLEKFEKKGFGRTEIVALIILSSTTNKPLKDLGNRRLKDQVTLKQLATEAHLDYDQLIAESRRIKEQIEAKGDRDLPPPLYEMGEVIEPKPTPSPKSRKQKKKATEKAKEAPAPKTTPNQTELD